MSQTEATPVATRRTSESGSAYLVAILALVVLTIAGLSLALITQTEMQIGANEKSIERSFYAADSGIALATARSLIEKRPAWSEIYRFRDPEGYGLRLEYELEVSPFFPINFGYSNLSSVNEAYEQGKDIYWQVNHAVTSTAVRRVPGSESPLAERSVTAMVFFDPVKESPADFVASEPSFLVGGDAEGQLGKIKF
jgi:hypothetical protein